MSRPSHVQVYMPDDMLTVLRELATRDRRSLSAMASLLIEEALQARQAAPRASDKPRGSRE